jgi:hypothetical protein
MTPLSDARAQWIADNPKPAGMSQADYDAMGRRSGRAPPSTTEPHPCRPARARGFGIHGCASEGGVHGVESRRRNERAGAKGARGSLALSVAGVVG